MKTVILDDDPTGTQSAADAFVLLRPGADEIRNAVREHDAVYVQTNSRALDEESAVALARSIRAAATEAAALMGAGVRFVLRGDSTLRGHVFAETDVFLDENAVMLFCPAFPAGGRTTRDGVHFVRIDGRDVPAAETEYARDPVFPFSSSDLGDYVAEKSERSSRLVTRDEVRSGELATALIEAPSGVVVVPDAEDADDIRSIAEAVRAAEVAGRRIVVRSAAPLAAELAGVAADGLLEPPIAPQGARILLACGSHTEGATKQLAEVERIWGAPEVIPTDESLADPPVAGTAAADAVRGRLLDGGFAVITTERDRRHDHGTLAHGERVMAALTAAVAALADDADVVVAKGGITSAEVATSGLGAREAVVLGQILPGVSVWSVEGRSGRTITYVVVPGNVGAADTLVEVLGRAGLARRQ